MLAAMAKDSIIYNHDGMELPVDDWKHDLLYPQMEDNFVFLNVPLSNCEGIAKSPTLSDFLSTKLEKEKSPTVLDQLKTSGKLIIAKLSFSHIVEIMAVDDSLARYFYEQECIKCTWSVRELRRQINTNLYVRAGISSNLLSLVKNV